MASAHSATAAVQSTSFMATSSKVKMPLSPTAPSPLTPPATGEARSGRTSDGSSGTTQARPHEQVDAKNTRLSASPCHQKRTRQLPATPKASSSTTSSSSAVPIRDSPNNPFIRGGAADVGLSGPNVWRAKDRILRFPRRERGKMTYVFRGQRVTYADPYASSGESDDDTTAHDFDQTTMDRLQPKLLFPLATVSKNSSTAAHSLSMKRSRSTSAALPFAAGKSMAHKAAQEDGNERTSKRSRLHGPSTDNHALLQRLERAGWADSDEDEEDEIDESVLANGHAHTQRTSGGYYRPGHTDWQDSESEEDEAEANPFLDVATTTAPPPPPEHQRGFDVTTMTALASSRAAWPQHSADRQWLGDQLRAHADTLTQSRHRRY